MTNSPAIFIDRDGTISREIGYVNHVSRFELLPRSAAGINRMHALGFKVVVVTNQAGAARGYFPAAMIDLVHDRMVALLKSEGAEVDGIYYCPHHPTAGQPPLRASCECRKPKTGLIDRASAELGLDPKRSYMIGDKYSDVELAHRVGAKGILVTSGYGLGELEHFGHTWPRQPDAICEDLEDAANWIEKDMKGSR